MRVGILSLNFSWHGEATAAATWVKHLKKQGYDATLFTMSKSGKQLKKMRTDYEYDVLKMKPVEETMDYLNRFDIIVSFGTGTVGEQPGELPPYFDSLGSMKTPLVVYMPSAGQVKNGYKNSLEFLSLPTIRGSLFLRESVKNFCYDGELRPYFKPLPFCIVKHPTELPDIVEDKPLRKFVSTSRMVPCKNIHKILRALRQFCLEDTFGVEFEFWGDKGASRFGWMLENEFGDFFLNKYRGSYTHDDLDKIYKDATFCFDLTNLANDGGVQNIYLEAIRHSTIPIVMPGWNVNESCVELKSDKLEDIAEGISDAALLGPSDRKVLLHRGREYIKEVHDPSLQTGKFMDYCRSLL